MVDDFPAEPDTTTKPRSKDARAFESSCGSNLFATTPGSAEPPPGLTKRTRNRNSFPIETARMARI